MKSSSRNMPVLAALIGQVAGAGTHGMDEASMLQMPVVETDLVVDTSDCRCPGYVQEECEAEAAQGCVWSDAGESNAPWCQCLGEPTACCEAQTVECLACKLEIEVDNVESTCCSGSVDICQNNGVHYLIVDGITSDPNSHLLGVTTYSWNAMEMTCTMTSYAYHDPTALYDCETCRELATSMGLEIGGAGWDFIGDYGVDGCYTYAYGQYACHAYCVNGATVTDAALPIDHATRVRLDDPEVSGQCGN